MNKPKIEMTRDFASDRNFYRLIIPKHWWYTTRFPRLALMWWLIQLVWREGADRWGA